MASALVNRVQADVLNVDDTQARSYEEAVTACAENHFTVLSRLRDMSESHRWVVVLEDDALPVDDFRQHAEAALAHVPYLAGFYISRAGADRNLGELQRALETHTAWAVGLHMASALAYAIRTDILPAALGRWPAYGPTASVERRFTDWAREYRGGDWHGEPRFFYTLPSLVDHGGDESIVFENSDIEPRRAWSLGVPPNWKTASAMYDPH